MDLQYTVLRSSKRSKLTITIERDRSIVVHAPSSVSEERIRQVVDSRRQWIYEKLFHTPKYRPLPHPPGKELVSGESLLYLGRNYRIEIKPGLNAVQFNRQFLVPFDPADNRRKAILQWFLIQAKSKIITKVKRCAKELGVTFNAIKITDLRYRWGSCTPKSNLHFNWRLIKAPMFVIDYVIVHELAHLLESNHTPAFWNIVRTHNPLMEKARAWLKENGQLLEQEI